MICERGCHISLAVREQQPVNADLHTDYRAVL